MSNVTPETMGYDPAGKTSGRRQFPFGKNVFFYWILIRLLINFSSFVKILCLNPLLSCLSSQWRGYFLAFDDFINTYNHHSMTAVAWLVTTKWEKVMNFDILLPPSPQKQDFSGTTSIAKNIANVVFWRQYASFFSSSKNKLTILRTV